LDWGIGGFMSIDSTNSVPHSEIVRVQRLREFSHYNAAREFIAGARILEFDPKVAEKHFRTVIELDSSNPYGYIYLLFALEDNGFPLSKILVVCNKLVEVASKKHIHGLDGISKEMMVGYLYKSEKMGLRIR
jgi:hypothetical protein